ncbi:MAG: glycosyltransferase family 25 protein, partial [Phycisphaerae bacterium]|nr:glycosyltransferase family 25 protein [Phycisphaerae bacterium]
AKTMLRRAIDKFRKKPEGLDVFERVYLVNLHRRKDRLEEFKARLPEDWPLPAIRIFNAVDKQKVPAPHWWKEGGGAWGCYRSHVSIMEECLGQDVQSVLILEDDAVFCEGFADKLRAFLSNLPLDWELAYLGGQHIKQHEQLPERLSEHVWSGYNVNRTHAFALSRTGMEKAYQFFNSPNDWLNKGDGHADRLLGQMVQAKAMLACCPGDWLVQQSNSPSEIGPGYEPKQEASRWNGAESLTKPMVAVLGPYRGGTSCVAGILHKLGVNMGGNFPRMVKDYPTWEAEMLGNLCREFYKEPELAETSTYEQRVARLRDWANVRRRACAGEPCGGKHPLMCLMVPEILEAWGEDTKFVLPVRSPGDVVASLTKVGWWHPQARERTTAKLIDQLVCGIENAAHWHVVPFTTLREHPEVIVNGLIEFLGIEPAPDQIQEAIESVRRPVTA